MSNKALVPLGLIAAAGVMGSLAGGHIGRTNRPGRKATMILSETTTTGAHGQPDGTRIVITSDLRVLFHDRYRDIAGECARDDGAPVVLDPVDIFGEERSVEDLERDARDTVRACYFNSYRYRGISAGALDKERSADRTHAQAFVDESR